MMLKLLLLIPLLIQAQYLPIAERYQEIESFLASDKYQDQIKQHLTDLYNTREVTQHIEQLIQKQLTRESFLKTVNHFLIRVSYEPEITKRIQKIFLRLIQNEAFKKGLLLIIREERSGTVIYKSLKKHITKQFQNDPRGVRMFNAMARAMFQCSYNRQIIAESLGNAFLKPEIRSTIRKEILAQPFSPADLDRLKQRIVMLGFKHTINAWLETTLSKTAAAVKMKLYSPENNTLLLTKEFDQLLLITFQNWLKKDETVDAFKNYLIPLIDKYQIFIEHFLHKLIVQKEYPFQTLSDLPISCYQIKKTNLTIPVDQLHPYLKQLLNTPKVQKEFIPLFFKYLK